ncbi:transglutaminase-like domain-containing protein [Glaciibacter superstes]|uniref:transglutaminase-like domain-containing protein n=1 Tax=Glaciibacter superstes TaxID=501023 RepID=UPI0003B4ED95|nr:transglutaminase-like domain-containing protein [Glaciibacter superstes]
MTGRRTQRKARRRHNGGLVVGNTIALAVTTMVAAWTFWPVYQSSQFVVVVAAAFALGALIAILGAAWGWPGWASVAATVGGYLLVGVPLAIPGLAIGKVLPSADGIVELIAASALSWKQLVTIVLPVGDYQSLLVPLLILVLVSTVIGLSIAVRSQHGELAVLAPIAVFLAGIALGPTEASFPVEVGLALLVGVLSWLLWLRWQKRRIAVRMTMQQSPGTIESPADRRLAAARSLVSAAIIIAIALAAGAAGAIALPAQAQRDVVRARVQQPFDPRDYPSPLSGFRAYLQSGSADEPLLTVDGLPAGARLRIATLDSYDGVVYAVGSEEVDSASGSFTRLPYRLDQSGVDGITVRVDVTVDGYSGAWVPGIGQLQSIEFTGDSAEARQDSFYYNDNSGTAAVLGGLHAGDRYKSESVVPTAPDDLSRLRPGTATVPEIGILPAGVSDAVARYVNADDPPGVQLQAAIDGLRAEGYISHGGDHEPVSRSGHGADRIAQLFAERPMLGDEEQYSVAAALIARELGFPARVVIGFAPDAAGDAPVTMTGADISAWIEVQAAGAGWLAIDPTPPVRDVPAKEPDDPTVVARPQSVVPPPAEDPLPERDLTPPENTQKDPPAPPNPWLAFLGTALVVAGWSILALAILLAPFLAVIAAKVRRRRLRSTESDTGRRISGGWREFADTAVDYGIEAPAAATRTEFAEAAGGMRPLVLASVVDRAVFSPEGGTGADADEVWRTVDELRRSFGEGRTRVQRLRARLSLRSFRGYAGDAGGSVTRSPSAGRLGEHGAGEHSAGEDSAGTGGEGARP